MHVLFFLFALLVAVVAVLLCCTIIPIGIFFCAAGESAAAAFDLFGCKLHWNTLIDVNIRSKGALFYEHHGHHCQSRQPRSANTQAKKKAPPIVSHR
jgi:hypothetical protein